MDIDVNLARGARAKEILENELYIESFEIIKNEVMTAWQQSPSRDLEGREKLYLMLAMLNKVQSTLQTVLETGKIAQHELTHKQNLYEKAKEWAGL